MKRIIYGFLMFSAALMAVSCGNDSSDSVILGYTTDNTLAIVKVNLKRLDEKIPKEEIMKDKSNTMSASDREKMQLFMNAKDNGIDIDKPLYMMTDKDGGNFAFSFFGWINDAAKFEKNFSKITGSKISIDKSKNLIYADKELIGAIKDDMMVLSRSMSNPMGGGSANTAPDEKFYTDFWNRKQTEKDGTIEQIEKSLGTEADICAWVNVYGMINTFSKGYIESLAINKLLVDAGVSASLDFDKGKIEFKSNTFFNDELQKVVEKHYDGKSVNYDIVKNIDLDKAQTFSVGYVSFDFLRYFVKEAGFEPIANSILESQGITLEDITASFDGSYAFGMYKAETVAEPVDSTFTYTYPKPSGFVALGLNGAKAKKLLDMVDSDTVFSSYGKVFHNDKLLVFASDESQFALLKSNTAAANKKLNKKSGVNSYTWAGGEDMNNSVGRHSKAKIVSMESTTKVEGGNASSETVIKLDKDKKNALHYLMGYE